MRRDWTSRDKKKHNETGGEFCLPLITLSDKIIFRDGTKKNRMRYDKTGSNGIGQDGTAQDEKEHDEIFKLNFGEISRQPDFNQGTEGEDLRLVFFFFQGEK